MEAVYQLLVYPFHGLEVGPQKFDRGIVCLCEGCRLWVFVHVVLFGVVFQAGREVSEIVRLVPLVDHIRYEEFAQITHLCCAQAIVPAIELLRGPLTALMTALARKFIHLSVRNEVHARPRRSPCRVSLLRVRSSAKGARSLMIRDRLVHRLLVLSP